MIRTKLLNANGLKNGWMRWSYVAEIQGTMSPPFTMTHLFSIQNMISMQYIFLAKLIIIIEPAVGKKKCLEKGCMKCTFGQMFVAQMKEKQLNIPCLNIGNILVGAS